MAATVLVDAENARRSVWPNLPERELAERSAEWGRRHGAHVIVVFDGPAPEVEGVESVSAGGRSADDAIVELAGSVGAPVWAVTSDRELRERLAGRTERLIGGGTYARELLAL
jgi:hypothetical protein